MRYLENSCHVDAICEDTDIRIKCCGYSGDGRVCQKSSKPVKMRNGTMLVSKACGIKRENLLTTFTGMMNQEYLVQFEVFPLKFEHGKF